MLQVNERAEWKIVVLGQVNRSIKPDLNEKSRECTGQNSLVLVRIRGQLRSGTRYLHKRKDAKTDESDRYDQICQAIQPQEAGFRKRRRQANMMLGNK